MKSPFVLALATLPLFAGAQPDETGQQAVDPQQLKNAVAVSEILDDKVMTKDDLEIGEVEDILLETDGTLHEYLIDFDVPGDAWNRGATSFRDDVANYEEPPLYEGESVEGELQFEYVAAKPEQVTFENKENILRVNLGRDGISELPRRDERRFAEREFVRASDIIGMDVDLADEESFGSVEDIVLTAEGDRIAAYVVDSWELLDKQRHAFPVDAVELVPDERETVIREDYGISGVRSSYTREQVEAMPEFDLEEYVED